VRTGSVLPALGNDLMLDCSSAISHVNKLEAN
jgi:hypothetical protein